MQLGPGIALLVFPLTLGDEVFLQNFECYVNTSLFRLTAIDEPSDCAEKHNDQIEGIPAGYPTAFAVNFRILLAQVILWETYFHLLIKGLILK